MSYFLTDEQEHELNLFLDQQNRNICKQQLESDDVPEELKEIIRSTIEADSPIPAFNPLHGYYSISFTPCQEGNRIYAHHHLSNESKALFDPSLENEKVQQFLQTSQQNSENENNLGEIVEDTAIADDLLDIISTTNPENLSKEQIEYFVGPPPENHNTIN
jgi:hypothetical protein